MTDQSPETPDDAGIWRWVWSPSKRYSVGALVIIGIVLGIIGWGGFNTAMEMTNTEEFCISCHEMRNNVYAEYQETIHYNNRTGVRATCPDCHVPRPWIYKIIRKIQASNELYHKVMGTIDTREKFEAERPKLAAHVWEAMMKTDSRECRNCHRFDYMDFVKQERRSKKRHARAIKNGQTCIECHQGISHELPEGWEDIWDAKFEKKDEGDEDKD